MGVKNIIPKLKKLFLCIFFFFVLFFPLLSFSANEKTVVYKAEIKGEIKAGSVQYVKRAINSAEENSADYLVIKIDTPGGLIDSTKKITEMIIESETEIIVFSHKKGGWTYSAGVFILLSADWAFAHPENSIGAAEPKTMSGEDLGEEDKTKLAISSWMKRIAEANDRNPEEAEKFVLQNMTISGKEALELGLIDGTAENIEQIMELLDASNPEIVSIYPNFLEKVFDTISHPYLVSLFLTLGFLGLVLAFRTGEFEISGFLGLAVLAIGLWGIGVINFSVLGVVFLLLGILLLAIEFFGDPGFGITGILGVISLGLGVFTFGAEPLLAPGIFDFATLLALGVLISLLILFLIVGRGAIKAIKSPIAFGPEAIIGKEGEVIEEINPQGRVKVKGEDWSAKSAQGEVIKEGSKVKVIKIEGNTLTVTKVENKNNK